MSENDPLKAIDYEKKQKWIKNSDMRQKDYLKK